MGILSLAGGGSSFEVRLLVCHINCLSPLWPFSPNLNGNILAQKEEPVQNLCQVIPKILLMKRKAKRGKTTS